MHSYPLTQDGLMRTSDLRYWYNWYNKKYFKNKLPKTLSVHYGKLKRNRLGIVCFLIKNWVPVELVVSQKFRTGLGSDDLAIATMLHEMVHISIGGKERKHGPRFRKEVKRLSRAGALDKLIY
jgi:hypothetical protein